MIKNYQPSHLTSLVEGYIKTFLAEPWNETWQAEWVEDRVKWLVNVPNFFGKVYISNGRVSGAILGYAVPFRGRLDFEIHELFVAPAQQHQGIGKALVQSVESDIAAGLVGKGSSVIHLLTAKASSAEAFYQAQGYEVSNRLGFMSKRLSG